jgi:transposase
MVQNFVESRREQGFLLPPDVREWLPGDHLAWFVIDAVAEMDLSAFYGAYRADGHGRAAYEPSLMVALVLYAFAGGQRSSRVIERHCRQDVAYRVISGNLIPDHATIARFVCRHERAVGELFGEVLRLCDRAGLVGPGVVRCGADRGAHAGTGGLVARRPPPARAASLAPPRFDPSLAPRAAAVGRAAAGGRP